MKNIFYYFSLLILPCSSMHAKGQSKQVVLEQIQMYSSIQPVGKYWHPNPTIVEAFAHTLDSALFRTLQLQIVGDYPANIKILNKPNQIGKLVIDWSKSPSVPYHAYLEIYELLPEQTYRNNMVNVDIPKKDSIQSTWFITCTILDANKTPQFQKTILMGMIPVNNQGIGYPVNIPVTTPKPLFKALQSGLTYFNKTGADLEYVEAKVPLSFATDNLMMPLMQTKPRWSVDTSRGFIQFAQNKERVILRVPAASMQKIDTKDKTNKNPFIAILPEIKKRTNTLFKEYYQALQPLRNVGENKDYTLETYIEFNPMIDPELRTTPPIRFLPDSLHKIFADTNLIGKFKVVERPTNNEWMYNSNEIYNGYDSTTIYKLNSVYPKGTIVVNKSVEGNIGKDSFKILFIDDIDVKIIYHNQVVVMVANGKNKPTNLIPIHQVANNTSSLLLMIAYSEIFQSPN